MDIENRIQTSHRLGYRALIVGETFSRRAYIKVAESPMIIKKIASNVVVLWSPVLSTDSPQRGMTNAADKLEIKFPVEAMVLL